MLTVVTPPATTTLCKLSDVKEELGIASSDTSHDSILNRLIAEASEIIQGAISRDLGLATYRETVPGFGSNYLMLSRRPIVSVSSVSYNGAAITDYTIEDAKAGMLYRRFGWMWTAAAIYHLDSGIAPSSEDPSFQVDYVAGYSLPNDGTPNLPLVFQRCAIETVVDWYTVAGESMRIQSKSVNGLTITYAKEAQEKGLPLTVLCRLDKLKAYA